MRRAFTRSIRSSSLLLLMGAVVGLMGCGESGSSAESANAESLTRSELVAQANAICQRGNEEKETALFAVAKERGEEEFEGPQRDRELSDLVVDIVLPVYEKIIAKLKALRPPPNDAATVSEIIGKFEAALRRAKAKPIKVVDDNPFVAADEAAEAYGLKKCLL